MVVTVVMVVMTVVMVGMVSDNGSGAGRPIRPPRARPDTWRRHAALPCGLCSGRHYGSIKPVRYRG